MSTLAHPSHFPFPFLAPPPPLTTHQFPGVRTLGTAEPGGSNSDSPEAAIKIPTGPLSLEKTESYALRLTSMADDLSPGPLGLSLCEAHTVVVGFPQTRRSVRQTLPKMEGALSIQT